MSIEVQKYRSIVRNEGNDRSLREEEKRSIELEKERRAEEKERFRKGEQEKEDRRREESLERKCINFSYPTKPSAAWKQLLCRTFFI